MRLDLSILQIIYFCSFTSNLSKQSYFDKNREASRKLFRIILKSAVTCAILNKYQMTAVVNNWREKTQFIED